MKRVVKAVGLLGRMPDGSARYLSDVTTYGGEFGNSHNREAAIHEAKVRRLCKERVIDCTVTFNDGQKGRKVKK
jgi:hypothetical protein